MTQWPSSWAFTASDQKLVSWAVAGMKICDVNCWPEKLTSWGMKHTPHDHDVFGLSQMTRRFPEDLYMNSVISCA